MVGTDGVEKSDKEDIAEGVADFLKSLYDGDGGEDVHQASTEF